MFDGGTVADYLANVKAFLDNNPDEGLPPLDLFSVAPMFNMPPVLTLLFTNPEGMAVDTVWAPIFSRSGIDQLAYVPPSFPVKQSDWPTLGDLIDSGKRVIVFMDAGR